MEESGKDTSEPEESQLEEAKADTPSQIQADPVATRQAEESSTVNVSISNIFWNRQPWRRLIANSSKSIQSWPWSP